jgi:hypothetical protein
MRDLIKILFSKAVILTYFFIGYAAITDQEAPLCSVGSTPAFSVNDAAYPTAIVIQITSAEHLRPAKESAHHIDLLPIRYHEFFVSQSSWERLESHELLIFIDPLSQPSRGRAPPSA